jgi:hypothetical protein
MELSRLIPIFETYNGLREDQTLLATEIAEALQRKHPGALGDNETSNVVPWLRKWARHFNYPLTPVPQGRKAGKSPFRKDEPQVTNYDEREEILARHREELAHYDDQRPGHLYRDAKVNVADIARSYTYVWDLETTDLNTFMGRTLMCSLMDLATLEMETRTVLEYVNGDITQDSLDEGERQLITWIVDRHDEADALIGHNTVGFDNGFLRGRLAALQMEGRPQGASMKNLADFFRLPVQKDEPSKWDWAGSREVHEKALERLKYRCEEDVRVNALLWQKLRPYFHDWKGK